MKLDKRDADVLRVIRQHVEPEEEFTCPGIINMCSGLRAKQHPELVKGIGKTSSKSLGHVLKRCQTAVIDGWRLCFRLDRKRDRWIYWFSQFPELEGLVTDDELDDQIKAADSISRKSKACVDALDALDERVAAKAEQAAAEAEQKAVEQPTLTIETVEPRDGDIVTDSTGQGWLYRRRLVDGQMRIEREPIPAAKGPSTPPPAAPELEQPPVRENDKRPPWLQRGESHPRDKAEWLAWQTRRASNFQDGDSVRLEPPKHSNLFFNTDGGIGLRFGHQPNGVRALAIETSTLWDGTLRNL